MKSLATMVSCRSASAAIYSYPPSGTKFPHSWRQAGSATSAVRPTTDTSQTMQYQKHPMNRKARFLLVALLALVGAIHQASVVLGGPSHREAGGRLRARAVPPHRYRPGSDTNRARNEQKMLPPAAPIPSEDRRNQQEIARQGLSQELLSQQHSSIEPNRELPRGHALPYQQPRAQVQPTRSQQSPPASQSDVRSNQEHFRQEIQRLNPPAIQLDLQRVRDAFEAHLEQTLAQARLDGARIERERAEQLERSRAENHQRAQREDQAPKPVERKRVQRDRIEQQIREANLVERGRAEALRQEQEEHEQMLRTREALEQELLEQQRLERQRLDQQLREAERLELERKQRDREREALERDKRAREALEKQMLEQQTREAERAERLRLEWKRKRDEQEQALREEQKLEREKREQDTLERQTVENLLRESERAERTRQEHRRRERESQEQTTPRERGRETVDRPRHEALDNSIDRKRREQGTSGFYAYARLEAEMLEEMAKKLDRLYNQSLQQEQLTHSAGRQELSRGTPKPLSREGLEESIVEDIDHLWTTFQTLLRYARHRQDSYGPQYPSEGTEVSSVRSSLVPHAREQQDRTDYREPSVRRQELLVPQVGSRQEANGATSRPASFPHVQSGNIGSRSAGSPGGLVPPVLSPQTLSHALATARGEVANAAPNTRLHNSRNSNMSARSPPSNSMATPVLVGAADDSVKGASIDGADHPGPLNDDPLSSPVAFSADNLSPTVHPETTPESVSLLQNEIQTPMSQEMPAASLPAAASPTGAAASEAPSSESVESRDPLSLPHSSLRGRRLEAPDSASAGKGELAAPGQGQEIDKSTAATLLAQPFQVNNRDLTGRPSATSPTPLTGRSEVALWTGNERAALPLASTSAPAAVPDAFHQPETHTGQHGAQQNATESGESSYIRALAGVRNRAKYGLTGSEAGDGEESEESEFPVVQLVTSSARPAPAGPQVPWPGALPVRTFGSTESSSGRYQVSDGTDYPNTPYRTYMYYPDPFSSPYSTHSYREDYGKRYSNRYYHEVAHKTALSWKEYVRRRDEKKAMEKRREEEAKEPKIGIIEGASQQNVGLLDPVPRRSFPRPPSTPIQRPTSYSPQVMRAPANSRPDTTRTTRVTFTPYSSISAARSSGTPMFRY